MRWCLNVINQFQWIIISVVFASIFYFYFFSHSQTCLLFIFLYSQQTFNFIRKIILSFAGPTTFTDYRRDDFNWITPPTTVQSNASWKKNQAKFSLTHNFCLIFSRSLQDRSQLTLLLIVEWIWIAKKKNNII